MQWGNTVVFIACSVMRMREVFFFFFFFEIETVETVTAISWVRFAL